MKRLLLLLTILFIVIACFAVNFAIADTVERTVVKPTVDDISSDNAISIAEAALYERFDIEDGLLDEKQTNAEFVVCSGWFDWPDDEPIWEVTIGEYKAIIDRHGKMIGVYLRRDIPWESDTLAETTEVQPLEADGTPEEAVQGSWELLGEIGDLPWGEDASGVTAEAKLIVNPYFCYGSEPVWLVVFSKNDEPVFKVLLRWDRQYIDMARWGKEFQREGVPKWVEQKDQYFPHGILGFGTWTQEEQAAFSAEYVPIVNHMEKENPHLDDPLNEMYWLTRHIYGIPAVDMISLDQAKEIAKEASVQIGADKGTYDERTVEAALDLTDPDKPIWRMLIGYDFISTSKDYKRFIVQIDAYTGQVIVIKHPETDIGYVFMSEVW